MSVKLFLVVSLATFVVSSPKNENELISTALGSSTHLVKEISKLFVDDVDKYSVDFNSMYKKYEIDSKVDEVKRYVLTGLKRAIEHANDYTKQTNAREEYQMKQSIEEIKKEDPVLGEKLTKFYEKLCEKNRISEDILRYYLDADKRSDELEKFWSGFEHQLAAKIKKFENFVIEHLPKKSKSKK